MTCQGPETGSCSTATRLHQQSAAKLYRGFALKQPLARFPAAFCCPACPGFSLAVALLPLRSHKPAAAYRTLHAVPWHQSNTSATGVALSKTAALVHEGSWEAASFPGHPAI